MTDRINRERTFDQIGYFPHASSDVNAAYKAYASAYLNYVDDSIKHFANRDMDLAPLRTAPGAHLDLVDDEAACISAYLDEAKGLIVSSGAYAHGDVASILADYPALAPFVEDGRLSLLFETRSF